MRGLDVQGLLDGEHADGRIYVASRSGLVDLMNVPATSALRTLSGARRDSALPRRERRAEGTR